MPLVVEVVESRVLRGNPLGDPHVRPTPVWLPPSYSRGTGSYPVIYMLAGYTGSGRSYLNWNAWSESLPERLDRLSRTGRLRDVIVVMPDCFTRYGGSQYLNSAATGRYEDYLVREIVPWVDRNFRTRPQAASRAVAGKSSGGYGAIVQAMKHPDVFGAVACHSGDMQFDLCYRSAFAKVLDQLQPYGGDARRFLRATEKLPRRTDAFPALEIVAMAACYSPDRRERAGFALPFDAGTGELRPAVWRRWLALDPVEMVRRRAEALRKMRLIFIDCGTRDEYALHYGARLLSRRLTALGIRHVHEEFDDGHMGITYRYDRSLPLLARVLARS